MAKRWIYIWWYNPAGPTNPVAEVDPTGVVRGLRDGTTEILAVSPFPQFYREAEITVIGYVCSVEVTPSPKTIFVGETLPLTVLPKDVDGNTPPRDAFGNIVEGLTTTWRSSDDSVATVDSNGVVTGVSSGKAKIIATVEAVEAVANITVKEVGSVVIEPEEATISVDETLTLNVTVYDKDGDELQDYPIEWTIPPGGIIAFDPLTQTVRGVAEGEVWITATVEGKSASAFIHVAQLGPYP